MIPEYIVARVVLEEHMHQQFQDAPDRLRPERPLQPRTSALIATRLRMSALLRAIANGIEPPRPVQDPVTSQQC